VVALGRRLVRHLGYAAAAIDGPSTRPPTEVRARLPFFDFGQMGRPTPPDRRHGGRWRATIDALQGEPDIGPGPRATGGWSMGTILGLPLVAAEPRITVAVLGLNGAHRTDQVSHPHRRAEGPAARCSSSCSGTDELFPRDKVSELFRALGTPDKRLHAHPGKHGAVPPEEFEASERFLALHLAPEGLSLTAHRIFSRRGPSPHERSGRTGGEGHQRSVGP